LRFQEEFLMIGVAVTMTEINKGTELMLRRKKEPPSPVLKRLGAETTFSLLKRRFILGFELRWERIDN